MTIVEQLQKFLGDGATITIVPDHPIKATMDDGSIVKYERLSAKYKMVNGSPMLTLDQPYPQAFVKKFFVWIEADILGAYGNLADVPPTATLQTSKGEYKVKIGLEPQ